MLIGNSYGNNNKSFQFIAREVDPKPYPGMSIQDLVQYPENAKTVGMEGKVTIAAFITKKGKPKNAYIIKGVFESLDQAALTAVNKSRWIPAKNNGKKVAVWVMIPVVFKLK